MRRSRHILAASLLASSVGAPIAAHAQQSPQSDSGRVADSAARHSTPVISGLATTIPAKNAPDAVSVVPVSDSTRPPAAALETLLDGRVPGATIETSTSDPPGTGMQVRVRGVTSIDNADAPLYVVDGVQVISSMTSVGSDGGVVTSEGDGINRIVDINPSDIESIQVLRGPSATAIYGAEGAAGVVIITTKHGTPGRTRWDVSGAVGHYSLANDIPMRQFPTLASAQAWYINDVTHDSTAANISADNALIQGIYGGPQDYQRQLFGNSQASYVGGISATGTRAATQYYVSASSRYDNGVVLNTGDDRQSLRGNVTQHVGSALSLTATLNYIEDVTRQGSITDGVEENPYEVMTYTPAFVDLDHQSASRNWTVNPFGPSNPFADEVESSSAARTSRLIAGGSIGWTAWRANHQSLDVDVTGGVDRAGLHDLLFAPPDLQSQQHTELPGTFVANEGHVTYTNYSGSFIHHIGGSWVDATTSAGYTSDRQDNTNPVRIGFNASGVSHPTGAVEDNFYSSSSTFQHSFYAQEQVITLASRLALTAGVTAQSSTLNSNGGEFFPYPHYGASYRLVRSWSVIDEIKLRAAYGVAGNLPPYGSIYAPQTTECIGIAIPCVQSPSAAPVTKPEAVREAELGFDMSMFTGRAQLSTTLYDKHASDLLLDAAPNPSTGYTSVIINGGAFKGQGAEIEVQATPLQMRNGFAWTTTATFTRNYSAVEALPAPPFYTGMGAVFARNYIALGRSVSELVNSNRVGADGLPLQAGDFLPGYEMSFADALSFRNFRVFGLADWSRGGSAEDLTNLELDLGTLAADSVLAVQRKAAYTAGLEPYTESASYFTLRQLGMSYALPAAVVRSIGFGRVASARLALTGYDLWSTFSYKGPDPQAAEFGVVQGGTFSLPVPYPPARSYYLGLDLGL